VRRGNLRRALSLAFKRTPHGPLRTVLLYETQGCGLCAETFRQLSRVSLDTAIEIIRVDIATDPGLFQRYALRVPVIATSGRELDAAGVSESALRAFVAASP